MSATGTGLSEDVLSLVQTVERLGDKDQERILKLVKLLVLAPVSVRDRTQVMLQRLLDRDMLMSMPECVAAVDEVLEYLERSTDSSVTCADHWRLLELPSPSTRRN